MTGRHSTDLSGVGAGRPPPLSDVSWFWRQSHLPDPQKKKKKKKKKWHEVEAGAMCKWNLHGGGDVGAMRTRWYGGGSEEELSGARRAEVGLCHRSESSGERGMIETRGNTRNKSGNIRKSP